MAQVSGFGLRQPNVRPSLIVAPVDVGASEKNGVKVRPVLVYETRAGLSLREAPTESLSTLARFGATTATCIDVPQSMTGIENALREALSPFGADIPVIITVDTYGAGGIITNQLSPLFFYTHEQKDAGLQYAAQQLTGGDVDALKRRLHGESGGQSWVDVYNFYHWTALRDRIQDGAKLLGTPDVINQHLCGFDAFGGQAVTETSFVRTSLCGNLAADGWNRSLLEAVGLPVSAFPQIVPIGTGLGKVRPEILNRIGITNAEVVAAGLHDTAGAFYGLNLMCPGSIFGSTGTWDLVAMLVNMGVITPETLSKLYDMELGIEGAKDTEVLIRNVKGGMLFEALKAELGAPNYDALFEGIEDTSVRFAILDVGSPDFPFTQGSGKIRSAVNAYCRATGQSRPGSDKSLAKAVYIGAMLGMLDTIKQFQGISGLVGTAPEYISTGGGVAKYNPLMIQALSDASGLPVVFTYERLAGLGNAAAALIGTGFASKEDVRESLLRGSSGVEYEPDPKEAQRWADLHGRMIGFRQR